MADPKGKDVKIDNSGTKDHDTDPPPDKITGQPTKKG